MYISIGQEAIIKASELIVIVDYDGFYNSELNKELKFMHITNDIQSNQEDIKSVVVTTEQLYFSPLSSATLQKRLNYTHHNKHNYVYE